MKARIVANGTFNSYLAGDLFDRNRDERLNTGATVGTRVLRVTCEDAETNSQGRA